MKRFLRAVLFLAAILLTATAVSGAGLGNFRKTNQYGGFSDVGETDWYYENVKAICEYGLMVAVTCRGFE